MCQTRVLMLALILLLFNTYTSASQVSIGINIPECSCGGETRHTEPIILINQTCDKPNTTPLYERYIDFEKENFSNETGIPNGTYIVPNYVHFVKFNSTNLTYVEMICILAAFQNQQPEKIYFHTNFNTTFEGKYWEVLKNNKTFMDVVVFEYMPMVTEIFGQPLDPKHAYYLTHATRFAGLQVMKKYGGIFLHLDYYIINNLNKYRVFEFTVNWDIGQDIGYQLIIGHKDSRFLNLYIESHRDSFRQDLWNYNINQRPTRDILHKQPHLVHGVCETLGAATKYITKVLQEYWYDWIIYDAVHLLIDHQYLLKNLTENATFPVEFNEENIAYYPITFREMAYDVYDSVGVPFPKDVKD